MPSQAALDALMDDKDLCIRLGTPEFNRLTKITTWASDEIDRLRELIAQERIACADVADQYAMSDDEMEHRTAAEIAEAIRRRPIVTY